jgi:hypothetical protein
LSATFLEVAEGAQHAPVKPPTPIIPAATAAFFIKLRLSVFIDIVD